MINFNDVTGNNAQEHNAHWLEILGHVYRIMIDGQSESGKYAKDSYKQKYQFLIKKHQSVILRLYDQKTFIEYLSDMLDVSKILTSTMQERGAKYFSCLMI